jgi:hypothetical protein
LQRLHARVGERDAVVAQVAGTDHLDILAHE